MPLNSIEKQFVERYCIHFDAKKACKEVGLPLDAWQEYLRNRFILAEIRKQNKENLADLVVSNEYMAEVFREIINDNSIPATARVKAAENLVKIQEKMTSDIASDDKDKKTSSHKAEELLNRVKHLLNMKQTENRDNKIEKSLDDILGFKDGTV